jgi:hypothetical protein
MRPGGCRDKGCGWELIVAKQLAKDLGGFDQQRFLPRAPDSGARIQWKGDIVAADKLSAIWPFLIECKKQEGWQIEGLLKTGNKHIIKEWYGKAAQQAQESFDKIPLLIFARNFQPWLVAFPYSLCSPITLVKHEAYYMMFSVEPRDLPHNVAYITTYQNFVDVYLKPTYAPKIKELGILELHKYTASKESPGKNGR